VIDLRRIVVVDAAAIQSERAAFEA
jgi:hypothetical protein